MNVTFQTGDLNEKNRQQTDNINNTIIILYIYISSILLSEYTSNLLIFVCNIFIMSVIFVVLRLNCNYIR